MTLHSRHHGVLTTLFASAVVAAVALPAGAASAASLTITDSSSDVWENVYNPDTQTDDWYDAGSKLNVDVLKTVVKHTNTTLVIKVTFAELKKQQVTFSTVDRLRFDQGPKLIAAIDTNTKWGGTEVLSHLPSGQPVKCPGMTHSIDYTTNKVQMSIPRSCLGNPGWVQVNSLARGTEDAQGVIHSYVDNAEQVGHADVTWSSKIHKG